MLAALSKERKERPFFGIVDITLRIEGNSSVRFQMIDNNDDYVAQSFSNSDCYEPYMLSQWISHARNIKGTVMDIGSSTGLYSITAAAANRSVSIFAYEPYFRAVARLIDNKQLNGFPKITIIPAAIGTSDEVVQLTVKNIEGPITTAGSIEHSSNMYSFPVACQSPSRAFAGVGKVDLIKIDAEGMESKIIKLAESYILQSQPTIFFECLSEQEMVAIQQTLAGLDYKTDVISESDKKLYPLSTETLKSNKNFIARHRLASQKK